MFRLLYCTLLRLHPARFRERFSEEMLSIFDHVEGRRAAARLVVDGLVSLVRQWTLRSGYWEERTIERVPWSAEGLPVFYTLESFKPRTSALVAGGLLTLGLFCVEYLDLRYDWAHPVFRPFRGIQFETSSDVETKPVLTPPLPRLGVAPVSSQQETISPHSGTKSLKAVPSSTGRPLLSQLNIPAAPSKTRPQARLDASGPKARAITATHLSPGQAVVSPKVPNLALRPYAGAYISDTPNEFTVLITAEDGQLAIEIPVEEPKSRLVPTVGTGLVFSDAHNNWIEFVKHDDGIAYELSIYRNGQHFKAHPKTRSNRK